MRKAPVVYTVCAVLALFALLTAAAGAQESEKAVTLTDILKQAECPLTADQAKQIKDLDLSSGWEAMRGLYGMFDDKQNDALKKALGASPGRNDGPERPRYLLQTVLLEKANCPLTEKQLASLKALPNERGSFRQANEILTEKQREAMQKAMPRRRNN